MVDTKPLLKFLGAGANVATQIATDKAVSSRRQTNSTFEMNKGSLLEGKKILMGVQKPQSFTHGLGRIPRAVFVSQPSDPSVEVVSYDATNVLMDGTDGVAFTLWVV